MPLSMAGAGSPCNTMSPGPRPTSVPSGIFIHPTLWPQYTNVADTTDIDSAGQRSRSIGRTVAQNTVELGRSGLIFGSSRQADLTEEGSSVEADTHYPYVRVSKNAPVHTVRTNGPYVWAVYRRPVGTGSA